MDNVLTFFVLMVSLVQCSDMGCHIDGFIAVVAHTFVLQQGPVTGRAADVIAAANTAAEVAMRLVRPGKNVIIYLTFYLATVFSNIMMHFSPFCHLFCL